MTPQERALLEDFLVQLAGVHAVDKDPDADALIRQQAARQPDALYFTIQRSLLQEQALNNAQARIQALEQKAQALEAAARSRETVPQPASRSFLSGLTAGGWGRPPEPPAAAAPLRPDGGNLGQSGSVIGSQIGARTAAPAGMAATQNFQPAVAAAVRPGLMGSGMGGFLGNAAAAAAGVAGGMFLFNGIEHLMNGGHDAAQPLASGTGEAPAAGTVTENVTDKVAEAAPGQDDAAQLADAGSADDGGWFDDGGLFDGGDDAIV